jgi:uracil-DNA glycosylase
MKSIRAPQESLAFDRLIAEIRGCTVCRDHLPFAPKPILRSRPSARLLIVSQAPGLRAHRSGLSFDDPSGERLRRWLGLDRERFYDGERIAIMPIGFCYPGRSATGGDRPPRPECAPLWHPRLLPLLREVRLMLFAGSYAIRRYLPAPRSRPMGKILEGWRDFPPDIFALPHPSWRGELWLRAHPDFAEGALPELQARLAQILA